MADLLECLVQIRALEETPKRLSRLVRASEPVAWSRQASPHWAPLEVLAHLADVEILHGVRLRLMLTSDDPALPAFAQDALARRAAYLSWPLDVALGRFTGRRAETLELLSTCSASELERSGRHPGRGRMTVADLVALMLAHDTTHVGQIRERLDLDNRENGES